MNFDEYLTQSATQDTVTVDSTWAQGRTTFGGLSVALLLHKIQQQVQDGSTLRSLSVNFCGPLQTEQVCQLSIETLREGKSVGHYQGRALQNNELVTVINACFGKGRESSIVVNSPNIALGEPGSGKLMPYIKGLTPEFTQHIDFAYAAGGFPFTNSKENHLHGWMRFKDSQSPLTNAHLIALIDAWPPAIIQKLKGPAPCATVSWNFEIVTPLTELTEPALANQWLWYEVEIEQAKDGYGQTRARIYQADGTLLALSSQLVVAYG